jgi:predicted methyltransferase
MRRLRLLRFLFPLALLSLAAALAVHAQEDWSKRDAWQRPAEVMDAIGAKPGSIVADVGCGKGYFTFHLAARVGPNGKVYAEDILSDHLNSIRELAAKRNLPQIETILGNPSDPRLPAGALDAILVVNAYHEMTEFDSMMSAFFRALKPGSVLAILDARDVPGKARKTYQNRHTLPQQLVREDAARAGFRFLRELPAYRNPDRDKDFYFLLFEKTAP